MKKSDLQCIIREELQNALNELKINSNPNAKNKDHRGYQDTIVNKIGRAHV